MNLEINSLFNNNNLCSNIRGKVYVKSDYNGILKTLSNGIPEIVKKKKNLY
jgi:hypothetical protein